MVDVGGQCPSSHVIGVPRLSPFFTTLSLPCIILNTNQRAKKWGRPGNEIIAHPHSLKNYRSTVTVILGHFSEKNYRSLLVRYMEDLDGSSEAGLSCDCECWVKRKGYMLV